ncbi:hypothetical protein TIFTF001_003372 [Ficus carica]|uniref:Uncharacterized protein n=1 Tax=Ficus carica TaxID=3494 RepID=A0AA87ZEQ8_FICCA|nr:hypothetical protein TIFTF001_003372 [Ficus carica]
MKTEPVDAAEVPPVFNFNRGEETGDSNRSISDLIDDLRTAFQSSVFDHVQDILVAKEEKLKREIGRMKEEFELTRESLGIARLQKAEAEEELKSFMAKCAKNMEAMRVKTTAAEERAKSAEERAKRSEERYEKLLSEVKKAESEKSSNLVELKKRNGELEVAKMKAEDELKVWNRKFAELEPRVTKLESDTMEIRIAENRAGPAILITDSDDDCAPRQRPNSSEKESSPRVMKRKRSSSEKLNEDENVVPNNRTGQDQERALEVGGSSKYPDPATVTSATNNPEYKNTVASNGQGVLGPLKANPAPEMKALSPHYAKCFADEFKEFLTSSSSDSDSE